MTAMLQVGRAVPVAPQVPGAEKAVTVVAKPRGLDSDRRRHVLRGSGLQRHGMVASLGVLLSTLVGISPSGALAQADEEDASPWRWRGTVSLWMAGVDGSAKLPVVNSNVDFSAGFSDLLDSLDFAFMGELEVRKGRWGGFTDLVFMDLSDSVSGTQSFNLSGPGGIVTLPAGVGVNTDAALRGGAWTLAGTYTAIEKPGFELLVIGGFRYLAFDTTVDWEATGNIGLLPPIARAGRATTQLEYWDAIAGMRGRVGLGESKWFVPYYADVGAGNSELTWQASAGIGYSFGRGEVTALYRHVEYEFDSDHPVTALRFSGPSIAFSWRW
jgi:hypothetical protein